MCGGIVKRGEVDFAERFWQTEYGKLSRACLDLCAGMYYTDWCWQKKSGKIEKS